MVSRAFSVYPASLQTASEAGLVFGTYVQRPEFAAQESLADGFETMVAR